MRDSRFVHGVINNHQGFHVIRGGRLSAIPFLCISRVCFHFRRTGVSILWKWIVRAVYTVVNTAGIFAFVLPFATSIKWTVPERSQRTQTCFDKHWPQTSRTQPSVTIDCPQKIRNIFSARHDVVVVGNGPGLLTLLLMPKKWALSTVFIPHNFVKWPWDLLFLGPFCTCLTT